MTVCGRGQWSSSAAGPAVAVIEGGRRRGKEEKEGKERQEHREGLGELSFFMFSVFPLCQSVSVGHVWPLCVCVHCC